MHMIYPKPTKEYLKKCKEEQDRLDKIYAQQRKEEEENLSPKEKKDRQDRAEYRAKALAIKEKYWK